MQPSYIAEITQVLASTHRISLSQLIYNQLDSVLVYKGIQSPAEQPVAVKVQRCLDDVHKRTLLREIATLEKLAGRHCVLHMYAWFEHSSANVTFVVIVTEYCSKDLMKDIKQHFDANKYHYPEAVMWEIADKLITEFAYMQSIGIAHRDIKPENIFLADGEVKIGDFGSSKKLEGTDLMHSISGTPLYLSPLLRTAMLQRDDLVQHDVYKSDVWSLGMTLLVMALLEVPLPLSNLTLTEIEACIQAVQYSDNFKDMLRCMLQPEESLRWSFSDLYSVLHETTLPQDEKLQDSSFESLPEVVLNEQSVTDVRRLELVEIGVEIESESSVVKDKEELVSKPHLPAKSERSKPSTPMVRAKRELHKMQGPGKACCALL